MSPLQSTAWGSRRRSADYISLPDAQKSTTSGCGEEEEEGGGGARGEGGGGGRSSHASSSKVSTPQMPSSSHLVRVRVRVGVRVSVSAPVVPELEG